MIWLVEEGCKSLKLTPEEYMEHFHSIYINRNTLRVTHQLYREMIVKERLSDRMRYSPPLTRHDECSRKWPICLWVIEKYLKNKEDPQVWTIRGRNPPNFLEDYMEQIESRKTASIEYYRGLSQIQDSDEKLLMGRIAHICQECEPPLEEFHLEEIHFEVAGESCAQIEEQLPIHHATTLSRILEASSSDEQTQPERSNSHSVKDSSTSIANASSGRIMPATGVEILKKSSSVHFYRTFWKSNRQLCEAMKVRRQ